VSSYSKSQKNEDISIMIKKLLLLAGITIVFTAVVSADMPFPPCAPGCAISVPSSAR
jgi:hypothetical protein